MTVAQARAELKQIRFLYNRIYDRKQRLSELRATMGKIRISSYGSVPVHGATSADRYKLEEAIDRATKLETCISDDLLAMAEAQQNIVKKIERLPQPYAEVLTRRYIRLQRFEQIAVDMNYSYRTIKRYCVTGLQKYADL